MFFLQTQPEIYEEQAAPQKALLSWGIDRLDKNLITGKTVLELGAGSGLFTQLLLQLNPQTLLATDHCTGILHKNILAHPQAQWEYLDAWNPACTKYRPQTICSSSLLQWMPKPLETLQGWNKAFPSAVNHYHLFFCAPTLDNFLQVHPELSCITWRTAEDWEKTFHLAGFKKIGIEESTYNIPFESPLALLRFFKATGAYIPNRISMPKLLQILRNALNQRVVTTWQLCALSAKGA